ncbi:hypothetical protein CCB80_12055 [Armatimonadetes bacterium Uphvl-Ar1]|nr:hypothetical protein CCB80_12055 [Armatimonadetes bacterium Uphvl-Ar1]
MPILKINSNILDIVAFVAVVGDGAALDNGFDRFGEEAHLFGVDAVVDVVLAVDGVSGGFEDIAESGAEGSAAAGADSNRAVGVDGDEFDVDFLGVVVLGFVEVAGVFEDIGQELCGPGGVEAEIDEAGTGDFGGEDGGVLRTKGSAGGCLGVCAPSLPLP